MTLFTFKISSLNPCARFSFLSLPATKRAPHPAPKTKKNSTSLNNNYDERHHLNIVTE